MTTPFLLISFGYVRISKNYSQGQREFLRKKKKNKFSENIQASPARLENLKAFWLSAPTRNNQSKVRIPATGIMGLRKQRKERPWGAGCGWGTLQRSPCWACMLIPQSSDGVLRTVAHRGQTLAEQGSSPEEMLGTPRGHRPRPRWVLLLLPLGKPMAVHGDGDSLSEDEPELGPHQ